MKEYMVSPKPTNRSTTDDAQVGKKEEKVKRRLWCSVCSLLGVETKGQAAEATKDIWYPYSSSLINGGHEMVRILLTHTVHVHIHRYTMMMIHLYALPTYLHVHIHRWHHRAQIHRESQRESGN